MNGFSNVEEFPSQIKNDIELAEGALRLIEQRLDGEPIPETAAGGDVAMLIDAVGELLVLEKQEEFGRHVSQRRMEGVVARLQTAIGRLKEWPELPRLLAIAPLAETFEEFELDWIIEGLIPLLPDPESFEERGLDDALGPLGRITAVQLRLTMDEGVWLPEFEVPLRALREAVRQTPDDETLLKTLTKGVAFHAIRSRQDLLEQNRKAIVDAEPIPDEFVSALDDFEREIIDNSLARWSLHLVIADILATGIAPSWAKPKQITTAAELAVVREDAPDLSLDLLHFARWARLKPKRLAELRDVVAPVLDWKPEDFEGTLEFRQEQRWRIDSGGLGFLPVRWTPKEGTSTLPPYSIEAARERLQELQEIAWMMIDAIEAVRFVTGAFRFGDDAPEELDDEILTEAIGIWKEEQMVDTGVFQDIPDEEWDDDLEDGPDGDGMPTLVTTDGEPLVSCIGTYEFAKKDRAEVVRHLEEMNELKRESVETSDRWVWLEDHRGQDLLIGSIEVGGNCMLVEAMSMPRFTRIGARLAESLGNLVSLADQETLRMTPELIARRSAEAGDVEGSTREVPPDIQRELVHRTLEQHYREWPDEDVPALGGMTPREAVTDPEGRARVISLLREIENSTASGPEPMRSFDLGFLWDDLGLDRDVD